MIIHNDFMLDDIPSSRESSMKSPSTLFVSSSNYDFSLFWMTSIVILAIIQKTDTK